MESLTEYRDKIYPHGYGQCYCGAFPSWPCLRYYSQRGYSKRLKHAHTRRSYLLGYSPWDKNGVIKCEVLK